jgi:hypothetical protein
VPAVLDGEASTLARSAGPTGQEANMDFLQLIGELDRLIDASPRMPLTDLALVREQEILALLGRLHAAVPPEVQRLHQLAEERTRLLTRAQADADWVVLQAQQEVDGLVHHPHLLRDARARAAEVLAEAERKAEMVRAGADAFADSTTATFEHELSDLETLMSRRILAIREGLASLSEHARVDPSQHARPLKPGEELLAPEPDVRHHYRVPPEESAPDASPPPS